MKQVYSCALFLLCLIFLGATLGAEAGTCKPSGKLRGKRPPKGHQKGNATNSMTLLLCGRQVLHYIQVFTPIHSDDEPVVALSTGWYNKGSRCLKYINIHGNGGTIKAKMDIYWSDA
ncbi:hypothetical protein SLE2022_028140 [Rubroshorea leprosula]